MSTSGHLSDGKSRPASDLSFARWPQAQRPIAILGLGSTVPTGAEMTHSGPRWLFLKFADLAVEGGDSLVEALPRCLNLVHLLRAEHCLLKRGGFGLEVSLK
jgi:hypothetical protein